MVAANSVQARLENSRVIPGIIPSSASVNGRPQNARPSPIVTGIASDLLHAGSHAYVTGIFRESPENSSPRTSRMYKLQGQALPPANQAQPSVVSLLISDNPDWSKHECGAAYPGCGPAFQRVQPPQSPPQARLPAPHRLSILIGDSNLGVTRATSP